MKKILAKRLRHLAHWLDPVETELAIKVSQSPQSVAGDAVVEWGENPQWSPEQSGNVIVAEPLLVSKYRRQNALHEVQKP